MQDLSLCVAFHGALLGPSLCELCDGIHNLQLGRFLSRRGCRNTEEFSYRFLLQHSSLDKGQDVVARPVHEQALWNERQKVVYGELSMAVERKMLMRRNKRS